jgi:hypothetical protein
MTKTILSRRNFFGAMMAAGAASNAAGASDNKSLWDRGDALLPAAQKVEVDGGQVSFGEDWTVEPGSGLSDQHIAVRTLLNRLKSESGITISSAGRRSKVIQLAVRPGTAARGQKEALARQGYKLQIEPQKITITGNDSAGLLYGVSTLAQLLSSKDGRSLPVCKIEDWPELELRVIHWCEKAHQSRMDTLKEYLDRAVDYRINAIGWHLENTFAYQKHPAISLPTAFTRNQVRELDRYARERFIELIPIVDFPAHMSYVLRHPEFAHLREVPKSSYMMCPTRQESWDLLFDMFDEVLDAFDGKYFHLSTDELFFDRYLATECGCAEKVKKFGRSGLFVELTQRAAKHLMDRGKEVMFWGERPLETKDIPKLPNTMIDAVEGWYSLERPGELEIERKHGIRALIYFSTKGGEKRLFPDYLPYRHHDIFSRNHLWTMYEIMCLAETRKSDNVMGTFMAAWDDRGSNLEIIWAGLIAGSSYGWNGANPKPGEMLPQFIKLFYGPGVDNMVQIYELMNDCALFWTYSWPRRESLSIPNLPDPTTLNNKPYWKDRYSKISFVKDRNQARQAVEKQSHVPNARSEGVFDDLNKEKQLTRRLIGLLEQSLGKVSRNEYNVEVMLAMAKVMDHNANLFLALGEIEEALAAAHRAQVSGQHAKAVSLLKSAEKIIEGVGNERERVYKDFVTTWEKSRFPSRQMDVFRRERNLNLEKWMRDLKEIRQAFAERHQVPAGG